MNMIPQSTRTKEHIAIVLVMLITAMVAIYYRPFENNSNEKPVTEQLP